MRLSLRRQSGAVAAIAVAALATLNAQDNWTKFRGQGLGYSLLPELTPNP